MKNGNITPAGMNDFIVCADIAVKAWEKGYREYEQILGEELFNNIFPGWQKAKADAMEPYFQRDSDKKAFIYTANGIDKGYITCRFDRTRKVGIICNNAVSPDFQGQGIGSKMYKFILEEFRKEGMTAAVVDTMNEDAYIPAQKAYEKAGFDKRLDRITYYMKL